MGGTMQGAERTGTSGDVKQYGFAGLLLQMWTARRGARTGRARRMQLLETLPLGGKRQLLLVRCGEEEFLVGGSLECVETIVKVGSVADTAWRSQDGPCE